MRSRNGLVAALAGAALCATLLSAPAAASQGALVMMEGLQAQSLSSDEMDSVRGTAVTLAQMEAAYVASLNRLALLRPGLMTEARRASFMAMWNNIIRPRLMALGLQ
jgi:hypothetical protein